MKNPKHISQLGLVSLAKQIHEMNGFELLAQASDNISIIDFPNGLNGTEKFPISKTGQITVDYYLGWNDKPLFLIDARAGKGLSDFPVIMTMKDFLFLNEKI